MLTSLHDTVGKKFVVLLLNKTTEETMQIAEHIRETVLNLKIPHISSPTHEYVTISLGVAMTVPSRTMYPDELIRWRIKLYINRNKTVEIKCMLYEEES